MSKLGNREETMSDINHYERLEFLGDAVVEFLSRLRGFDTVTLLSSHLFSTHVCFAVTFILLIDVIIVLTYIAAVPICTTSFPSLRRVVWLRIARHLYRINICLHWPGFVRAVMFHMISVIAIWKYLVAMEIVRVVQKLNLHDIMLYAHGPDLCHDSVLHHAMANCLEALMGALAVELYLYLYRVLLLYIINCTFFLLIPSARLPLTLLCVAMVA
jgi:hypothetical protein